MQKKKKKNKTKRKLSKYSEKDSNDVEEQKYSNPK